MVNEQMKRFVLPIVLALLLLVGLVPGVNAGEQWCEGDPLVVVKTPGGASVPIYVTSGALGPEHLPAVLAARISYTAKPADGGRATLVKISVVIPDDAFESSFQTRSTSSTGPLGTLTVLSMTTGISGRAMTMQFKVNVG